MVHTAVKGSTVGSGTTVNAEDAKLFSKPDRPVEHKEEPKLNEMTLRWKRIQTNDWENIPMFTAIMLMALVAPGNYVATTILTAIFTACRVLHTIFYRYALQPFRSQVWALGVLCQLALGANGIYGAFAYTQWNL